MKTSHGKLMSLAFGLLLAFLLFVPMRSGQEDQLVLQPGALKMNVGDSYTVRCALSSEDTNQRLRFASSDSRVASIGNDGTVYALASGEVTISARASGGAHAEMKVTVDGVPMSELSLNVKELHIEKGQYSGMRVSYNADASDTRLQWLSSDESVVYVDSTGRIEGVGGG
ncbi:MAG: Ig-like domain-containing protein, partial [Clostridia bacterium]|nr:Ig-like domain-containing protein [Clostridia bacterium]